ncbi:MAG: radical SAM protein [Acidobacteria bacterium]|nr:radical SAM protein [Acidobacteriota bacterium]
MADRFRIFNQPASSILARTSGFIRQAGFTHSLTPARNCTFGCTYCYVPTMRIYGGLKREDWERWGQFTTYKENAAALLAKALKPGMLIYCSPLVDPYQPAEEQQAMMPGILEALLHCPPAVFTIQTRGPLILRDVAMLKELDRRTSLRVSFSVTTDDDAVRRLYEPHCAPIEERLAAIDALRCAGLAVHATLAPLLPCDPTRLLDAVLAVTVEPVVGDPLHLRETKRHGATTREQAFRIAQKHQHEPWFQSAFQSRIVEQMKQHAAQRGRAFAVGPEAFTWLTYSTHSE